MTKKTTVKPRPPNTSYRLDADTRDMIAAAAQVLAVSETDVVRQAVRVFVRREGIDDADAARKILAKKKVL